MGGSGSFLRLFLQKRFGLLLADQTHAAWQTRACSCACRHMHLCNGTCNGACNGACNSACRRTQWCIWANASACNGAFHSLGKLSLQKHVPMESLEPAFWSWHFLQFYALQTTNVSQMCFFATLTPKMQLLLNVPQPNSQVPTYCCHTN